MTNTTQLSLISAESCRWQFRNIDSVEVLLKCIEFIKNCCPEKSPSGILSALAARSKGVTIEGNCVLLGERAVIPASLQARILKTLHLGHPGIVWMKGVPRQQVYWPRINMDIERTVRICVGCSEHANNPRKTELHENLKFFLGIGLILIMLVLFMVKCIW